MSIVRVGLTLIAAGLLAQAPAPQLPPDTIYYNGHAWPNLRYLIVSVRGGRPEEARTWKLREDRSSFDEEIVTSDQERLRA